MSKRIEISFGKGELKDVLKRMGIESEFSERHIRLMEEYRAIDFGVNAIIDRAAAIEAFSEIKRLYPEAILTELGISFEDSFTLDTYNGISEERREIEKKAYVIKMATANKRFLELWDEIRREIKNESNLDPKRNLLQELRDAVDAECGNESIRLNIVAETVISAVIGDGWNITEDSEKRITDTKLSDSIEKGIMLYATNKNGDKLEVRIVGGEVYIHVSDKDGNVQKCDLLLSKLISKVEKRTAEIFEGNDLGGLTMVSNSMSYGNDDSKVPLIEEPYEDKPKMPEKPVPKKK